MPTHFTDCSECYESNTYINHTKIENVLMECGVPKEIAEIIIKKSINLKKCDYCSSVLCKEHQISAIKWAKYYKHIDGLMCNSCYGGY